MVEEEHKTTNTKPVHTVIMHQHLVVLNLHCYLIDDKTLQSSINTMSIIYKV